MRVKTSARSTGSDCRSIAQQRLLFGLVDQGHALVDALDRGRRRRDRDLGRIGEITVGELLDRLRHGRREEQGLALRRHQRDDPLQRVDEAEVEHLVGLVEDEDLELAQGQRALVDQVEQPARRRDQHVDAARDVRTLLPIEDAAEHGADREAHELAIGLGAVGDLPGELARRREHQHAAGRACGMLRERRPAGRATAA